MTTGLWVPITLSNSITMRSLQLLIVKNFCNRYSCIAGDRFAPRFVFCNGIFFWRKSRLPLLDP